MSTKTLQAYHIDLYQFLCFLELNRKSSKVIGVDKFIIRQYMETLAKWKPRTIKRKIASLKAMFNYLEFEDHIAISPFRKMRIRLKQPTYLPVVLDQHEVKKVFQEVYNRQTNIVNKYCYKYAAATRDLAVLEMLFATGIRVSELCSLQVSNIDLKTGVVRIIGKGDKERIIQVINQEARIALIEYFWLFQGAIEQTQYFFINRLGNPLSSQSVRYMIRDYTSSAGLAKHVTPHTFRHTFATLLLEADVDIKYIQHFLGHSSIMTTQIYTHVSREQERKLLATRHPRGKFKLRDRGATVILNKG
ncbi:MAG: tyrosine-type recombinase/integrase [Bacteroidetes bacterium]|nr:tyrosine-type recombinase/integrase [Bacteroidota bacterium]